MRMSYRGVILGFNENYDSLTGRDYNSKVVASLSVATTTNIDNDHHAAFNGLMERSELPAQIAALYDRDSEAKNRILFDAMSVEARYLHAESKPAFSYNFTTIFDALHAFMRAVQASYLKEDFRDASKIVHDCLRRMVKGRQVFPRNQGFIHIIRLTNDTDLSFKHSLH